MVAAWAARFGLTLSSGMLLLPDTHVISEPIKYTITTTDITNGSGGRKGTIYTIDYVVEGKGDGKTSKDHYWNSINLTNCWKTFPFGEIVYNSLFTYPNWNIVSWN